MTEVDNRLKKTTFYLRDYLKPNGIYPYEYLFNDMEHWLAAGHTVCLISVPGFLMVSGYPADTDSSCPPWISDNEFYKTAKDAVNKTNPVPDSE